MYVLNLLLRLLEIFRLSLNNLKQYEVISRNHNNRKYQSSSAIFLTQLFLKVYSSTVRQGVVGYIFIFSLKGVSYLGKSLLCQEFQILK